MSIELPKDAEGCEIPLDTEVLYDMCGTKVSVKEFLSRTSVENQRTGWTIKAAYEGNIDCNSFKPKNTHITKPDSWEKLLEDLGRCSDVSDYEECAYFGTDAGSCSSCVAGQEASCSKTAMRDIASRIRKLRSED